MMLNYRALVTALSIALVPVSVRAQQSSDYVRQELHIPMRDGVELFAVALIPKTSKPLPIMLIRTPFSAAGAIRTADVPAQYAELAADGYIFVAEDIRGRFGSGGEFVTTRAQNDPRNPRGTNESTDAFDTVDWLLKNVAGHNGRVGVMGVSYGGWLAALVAVGAHPAVKAISPQGLMADTWLGDDFFHQGAFRQTQGVLFSAVIEADPKGFSDFEISGDDEFAFYAAFPTLDSLARATGVANLQSWTGFRAHPAYDEYWQTKALQNVLTRSEVPTLFVGGWWDAEDLLGPQIAYHTVEKSDVRNHNRIVLGPWAHGTWARPGGDSLGPLHLGSKTSDYFRANIQRPWFAHYLHGQGDAAFPEAWAFETGANVWRTFDAWPPRNAQPRSLYLRSNGWLSFEAPNATDEPAFDSYKSNPADPVPYVQRPDNGSGWSTWLLRDQRFASKRSDVLTWTSAPLDEDITIAGDVVAQIFASTTGSDADWVVKLIDVFPDTATGMGGYQLMVNADVMRGRYWKSFRTATPIPPNTVTPFVVDLHEQLYRFRKGHRMMVQVQSSWFPLYDRNPQTFVPNIFEARASDYQAHEHRVFHTVQYPSQIRLKVLPR